MTNNETATKTTSSSLPKHVFDVKVNKQTIFDVIMSERASQRQGTHSTKTRAEVSGGGRKPFRQKGTGNARQGSIRSPQWVGGGVAWGPKPEKNYTLKVNKKVRKLAFASALTLKAQNKAVLVHEFKSEEKPNTKKLLNQLTALNLKVKRQNNQSKKQETLSWDSQKIKVLIITTDVNIWKSASNLPKVFATRLANLTVEMIVGADILIFAPTEMKKLGGTK